MILCVGCKTPQRCSVVELLSAAGLERWLAMNNVLQVRRRCRSSPCPPSGESRSKERRWKRERRRRKEEEPLLSKCRRDKGDLEFRNELLFVQVLIGGSRREGNEANTEATAKGEERCWVGRQSALFCTFLGQFGMWLPPPPMSQTNVTLFAQLLQHAHRTTQPHERRVRHCLLLCRNVSCQGSTQEARDRAFLPKHMNFICFPHSA